MFKALKSFGGKISMKQGEVKDIEDEEIIKDLLNAGYIQEIKDNTKKIDTKIKDEIQEIKEKVEKEVKKTRISKNKK